LIPNRFVSNDNLSVFIAGRGKSHGPHKFHIPVVPRRHSFDDRILATAVSKYSFCQKLGHLLEQ